VLDFDPAAGSQRQLVLRDLITFSADLDRSNFPRKARMLCTGNSAPERRDGRDHSLISALCAENYFYPDLPKGYKSLSTSCRWLPAAGSKSSTTVQRSASASTRLHLEEDAAKICTKAFHNRPPRRTSITTDAARALRNRLRAGHAAPAEAYAYLTRSGKFCCTPASATATWKKVRCAATPT